MLNLTELLTQAFANLISGLIANVVYIMIAIWGFRLLQREIKQGIKKIPEWLNQWDDIKMKHYNIQRATGMRT